MKRNKVKRTAAITKAQLGLQKKKMIEAMEDDPDAVQTAENSRWMQDQISVAHENTDLIRLYLNEKFNLTEILDTLIGVAKNPRRPATQLAAAKFLVELAGFITVKEQAYLRIGTRDMEDSRDVPTKVFRIGHLPSLEALPPPDDGAAVPMPVDD